MFITLDLTLTFFHAELRVIIHFGLRVFVQNINIYAYECINVYLNGNFIVDQNERKEHFSPRQVIKSRRSY